MPVTLLFVLLATPPVSPPSAAPATVAPPRAIDWANHDYGFFALKGGIAELREYVEGGGHDSHVWKFVRAQPLQLAGRALTAVHITRDDYGAQGGSHTVTLVIVFEGARDRGRFELPGTVGTAVEVKGAIIEGRWRVGKTTYRSAWRLRDDTLVRVKGAPPGDGASGGGSK